MARWTSEGTYLPDRLFNLRNRGFFNTTDLYLGGTVETYAITASVGVGRSCNCETCCQRLRRSELGENYYGGRKITTNKHNGEKRL